MKCELWVIESRPLSGGPWVIEDHYTDYYMTEDQMVWLQEKYGHRSEFRLARYVHDQENR